MKCHSDPKDAPKEFLMQYGDKKNETIERLANIDQLTGCYNRRSFHKDLTKSIKMCEDGRLHTLSLATFDIDHFKSFNDRYGHPTGDKILEDIVALVKKIQSPRERLYRVGGEEFMVVYHNTTLQEAIGSCQEIQKSLKEYKIHEGNITLSFGVCQY